MYHAVLPIKIQCDKSEKLLFPLCRRCAETKQHECNHTEDERAFIGTWCTNELEKAIEKGYEVKKGLRGMAFRENQRQSIQGIRSQIRKDQNGIITTRHRPRMFI